MGSKIFFLATMLLLLGASAWAATNGNLAQDLKEGSFEVAAGAIGLILVIIVYSVYTKPRKEKVKKTLFWSIIGITVLATLYLAGGTIYLNMVSATGGPVHWHTDYEVWNCGTMLDLTDPTGFTNRIGTWAVHEHNDDRMHIEGTLVDLHDASFEHFFETVGTHMDTDAMTFPTNNGTVRLPLKGTCNGKPAELQGYLFRVENPGMAKNWTFTQTKIAYPFNVVMAPQSGIPPGDCLVVEYGPVKPTTDHLCASYRFAEQRGELHGR